MSPARRRAHAAHRRRRGISLVEVMTAVTVLGIGVLGLAGTASVVALQMGGGGQRTAAAGVAQQKYDSLSAVACTSLVSSTDSVRNVRVTWTVADSGFSRWVRQTVRFRTRRGYRTLTYDSMIPCR